MGRMRNKRLPKFEFVDDREEMLGVSPVCDYSAVDHALLDLEIVSPIVKSVVVHAVMPTAQQVEDGAPGWIEASVENGTIEIFLLVSDRPEFSAGAVRKINRNFVQLLRMGSAVMDLNHVFLRQVASMIVETASAPIIMEADAISRGWCGMHESRLPIKAPAG